ncbi:MAG: hypothetical protein AAF191_12590, partial [Verrucomicrobiota bacterium]
PRGSVIEAAIRTRDGSPMKTPSVRKHGFFSGAEIYRDRKYRFTKVPESLEGGDLVQTFNNDKDGGALSPTYTLEISEPGMLYLLLDSRVFPNDLPWLQSPDERTPSFRLTKETVQTDADFHFAVYEAEVDPTTYHLGTQSGASFYSLVGVNRD